MHHDYVVVGAGLTGATIARVLSDAGRRVLVVDRRLRIAGNIHDSTHDCGIRFHSYGPHYFRTNSEEIWSFVRRFAEFYPFAAIVKTWVDGNLEPWPVTQEYLLRQVGPAWKPSFQGNPQNFEEACLAIMPKEIYKKFVHGYTRKQWGKDPKELDTTLAGRFSVRKNTDPRLVLHTYQGLPRDGYTAMVQAMLAGIDVRLGCDYLTRKTDFYPQLRTFFTGPIDEFFGFDIGKLAYRAQQRKLEYKPNCLNFQTYVQVNNPSGEENVPLRTIEWKHILPEEEKDRVHGTLLTYETPCTPSEPDQYEYPFPDKENKELYARYAKRAAALGHIVFCGRLGSYKYYDMDVAIGHALRCAQEELERNTS